MVVLLGFFGLGKLIFIRIMNVFEFIDDGSLVVNGYELVNSLFKELVNFCKEVGMVF